MTDYAELKRLAERLRFSGRYAYETEDQATDRRLVTRHEAALEIERLADRIGQLQADFDDCNLHRAKAVSDLGPVPN